VSETTAESQERTMQSIMKVAARADQLAETAIAIKENQGHQTQQISNTHTEMKKELNEQARLVCVLSESFRRDIDRVCRDAECARTLDKVMQEIEQRTLDERLLMLQRNVGVVVNEKYGLLRTELRDDFVPGLVKKEAKEFVDLKVCVCVYVVVRDCVCLHTYIVVV
jgi:hypothetical protein